MRVAVVSPFVDRRHGTERALAELLERLARDYQCEIHLYSQRVEDLALGQCSTPSGRPGKILWHKLPSIPGPHLFQFLFWLFSNAFSRRWDRSIHGLRFDMVLSPGINCFDADVVLVHALFHRLRELARDEAESFAVSGPLRRLHRRTYYSFLTWLEKKIYSDTQVSLAAVSSRTASLLGTYFHREDVRVIPNGVDVTQFSPARRLEFRKKIRARYEFQESDFVLLLIGNDWRNKGLSTVLAAMAASSESPTQLLVAGQDATAPAFHQAARTLGVGDRCRWEAASVEAIHLYAAADAYVSPTREDAFALPPLESMACGLPIITSANNGGSQIVTDGVDGFVLQDANDAVTLTGYLRNLQENPDIRRRIGENARRTAEAYTWERNAAAVWEFLNEVFSRKRPSRPRP